MPTLRNILSTLAADVKALNLDDRISYRYLASKFYNKIDYYLRLEARSREIYSDLSSWKVIQCVTMEEVPLTTCGNIESCSAVYRSKIKIPEVFKSNYGLIIKVFSIDGSREFKLIKPFEYKDYINRPYNKNVYVFWLENNYIIIPDRYIESVKVMLIPKNASEVDKINGTLDKCSSPLDGEVSFPDYLVTLALKDVFTELAGRGGIMEDEKGDDNTNKKT